MRYWQAAVVSVSMGFALPAVAQMVERSATRAAAEAEVRDRLGKFDADADGIVTREEILAFAKARSAERAAKTFAEMDKDEDGQVSRAEYDAYMTTRTEAVEGTVAPDAKPIDIEAAVKAALARFDGADANKDGVLSAEERSGGR